MAKGHRSQIKRERNAVKDTIALIHFPSSGISFSSKQYFL